MYQQELKDSHKRQKNSFKKETKQKSKGQHTIFAEEDEDVIVVGEDNKSEEQKFATPAEEVIF